VNLIGAPSERRGKPLSQWAQGEAKTGTTDVDGGVKKEQKKS